MSCRVHVGNNTNTGHITTEALGKPIMHTGDGIKNTPDSLCWLLSELPILVGMQGRESDLLTSSYQNSISNPVSGTNSV